MTARTMTVKVLYFASLRDAAGIAEETVEVPAAADAAGLYALLQARHGFAMPGERLRVAIDGAFAQWADPLRDGCEVAFIPPVSGG
jgi:molybdopterin synthase sulfur carrier subunit